VGARPGNMPSKSQREKTAIVIFARQPEYGRVKTRLAATIGPEAALSLHIACLQATTKLVATLPKGIAKYLYLTGTPEIAHRTAQRLKIPPSLQTRTQTDGDLGTRLSHALATLLRQGHRNVIFLGSDSPTLSRERLREASRALEQGRIENDTINDAVIGPAQDGGYYLIGTNAYRPEIFQAIDWGTENAFQQTMARLQQARCRVAQLPTWYDIDRLEDLQRLDQDVRRGRAHHLRPLRAWLQTESY